MTPNTKALLVKLGKYLGAAAIAGVVTLLASPDVLNIIPTAYTFLIPTVLIPGLVELDKKLFGKTPPIPVPINPPVPVPVPGPTGPSGTTGVPGALGIGPGSAPLAGATDSTVTPAGF